MIFITQALLLWTASVPAMQATQFFYGVVTASDIAYFSYIYRSCSKSHRFGFLALLRGDLTFWICSLLQCNRFEEIPKGHLLQPQCPAPGVYSGLRVGSAACQLWPHVIQQHPGVHSGSHCHRSPHFLLLANATEEHVLSSKTWETDCSRTVKRNKCITGRWRRWNGEWRRRAWCWEAWGIYRYAELRPSPPPAVEGFPPLLFL